MCGIFGFLGFDDHHLLKQMAASIDHRGPDSQGFYSHDAFSMGMCRLSIIDLAGGDQPIFNEDKTIAVCYNGEIYNYVELRDQLKSLGHVFSTHTDTEVIVHAYEQWGYDCLQYFNGMFAFALYDVKKEQVFLVRDRSGQKPLYFYHQDGRFVFSSEIKAILKADFIPRAVNETAIDAYLTLRYVPEPSTMFKNIVTLPAAHYLVIDSKNKIDIRRYWDIKLCAKGEYLSVKDSILQVEAQLKRAVRLTMRSDVPVGAYLSAGIDSSLLVALMCQDHDNVNTYSIGFNSSIDETGFAKETANLLGTNHHEIHCGPEDISLLPKVIYHMDRPVGDALIIAFYKLAELASRDVKVVLSGEGADEIFAGYQFHKVMQIFNLYSRLMPNVLHRGLMVPVLKLMPVWLLNAFFSFPAGLGKQGKNHFVEYFKNFSRQSAFSNYISLKTLWRKDARASLYSNQYQGYLNDHWMPEVRDSSGHFLDVLLKLQWDEWLQDWAIIRQDKNTMAHSLEVRLPFLDHELIELGFKISPKLKASLFKDKIIERQVAQKILPKQVVKRKKQPFYFPVKYFYESKQFNDLVKLTLNKKQILKRGYFNPDYIQGLLTKMQTREFIYLKQVVSLVILELWHMEFIDT